MAVYDDQKVKDELDGSHDNLNESGDVRQSEIDALNSSFDAPAIDDKERNAVRPGSAPIDKAGKEEASQLDEKLGKGFTGGQIGPQEPMARRRARKLLKVAFGTPRRKVATILITGGFGLTAGFGIFSLLPAKSIQMILGLQSHYFGVGDEVAGDTMERLFSRYLIKQVIPGMADGLCTTTRVDKSCARAADGDGPINTLFKAWRQGKIESIMANKYNIEIVRVGSGRSATFYIHTPDIANGKALLGSYDELVNFDGNIFAKLDGDTNVNGKKMRQHIKQATKDSTLFKQHLYRYFINRHAEHKYGVRHCTFACEFRDKGEDAWGKGADRLHAGKAWVTRFVTRGMTEGHSLMLECALSNFDCASFGAPGNDGVRVSKYEADLRNRVITARNTDVDFDKLVKDYDTIKKNGLVAYVIEKIFGKAAGKLAAYAVPIIGWIDLAVTLNVGAQNIGPALRMLEYSVKGATAVAYFSGLSTAVDEQRSGDAVSIATGSLVNTFSEGGVDASQSALYHTVNDSSLLATNAVSTKRADMEKICEFEGGVSDDGLICKNESLVSSNVTDWAMKGSQAVMLGMQFNKIFAPYLEPMLLAWTTVSGWLGQLGSWLFSPISGFAKEAFESFLNDNPAAKAWVDARQEDIMKAVTTVMNIVFRPGFADNPNGSNNYNQAAIGANVLANTVNRDVYGAKRVTQAEADNNQAILAQRQAEEFAMSPWYARMFDQDNPRSFVSRLAMSLPMSSTATPQYAIANYAHSISMIPMTLMQTLAAALPNAHASIRMPYANPAGVQLNQYDLNDPVLDEDPQVTWDTYKCSEPDQEKKWAEQYGRIDGIETSSWKTALSGPSVADFQKALDGFYETGTATQQFELTKSNPCKLLKAVISSAGSLFDKSMIPERPPEPTSGGTINTTGDSATGADGTGVSKDGWVWPIQKGLQPGPCWNRPVFGKLHAGMDINSSVPNAPVYAMHDGEVVSRTIDSAAGLNIRVKTPKGIYYWYQHLSSASVVVGDTVKANQQIANGGKTGNVQAYSPVHLHVVVSRENDYPSYGSLKASFDPMEVLPLPAPDNYRCTGAGT